MGSVNFCYRHAAMWTVDSCDFIENDKIIKSWACSLPARFFFLCDVVESLGRASFALLKIAYGVIEGLVVWNRKCKNLMHGCKELYRGLNNAIGSGVGILFTSFAVEYRHFSFLLVAVGVSIIVLSAFAYVDISQNKLPFNLTKILPFTFHVK